MPNPIFPALPSGKTQDSSKYEVSKKDPAMRAEMEGGYVVSRARTTRRPTRLFKTGFTSITGADKQVLDDFYDLVAGGSVIFDWTDPSSGLVYAVRFTGSFGFKYAGRGATSLWDCSFELEQA